MLTVGVQAIVDAILTAGKSKTFLWLSPSQWAAFSTLFTLGTILVGIWNIKILQKQQQKNQQFQRELEQSRTEFEIMREDVLSTVIPVISIDNFALGNKYNRQKDLVLTTGILKVTYEKESFGRTYLILAPLYFHSFGMPIGGIDNIIHDSSIEQSPRHGSFTTKYNCIQYAMTFHQLSSPLIKHEDLKAI